MVMFDLRLRKRMRSSFMHLVIASTHSRLCSTESHCSRRLTSALLRLRMRKQCICSGVSGTSFISTVSILNIPSTVSFFSSPLPYISRSVNK